MEVESDLKLPAYTDAEIMMDDANISVIELMSRFGRLSSYSPHWAKIHGR